jgi:hypothetical protein
VIKDSQVRGGATACPFRITGISVFDPDQVPRDSLVAHPGDSVLVEGTWPSEVQEAFLDQTEADIIPFEDWEDYGCCHNANANFRVPEGTPPGEVHIRLLGAGFQLTSPNKIRIAQ